MKGFWGLIIALLFGAGAPAMALVIVREGVSEYTIVVAAEAIAPELTAAKELQEHLKLVTGAQLPLVTEAQAPGGEKRIYVGQTEAFKRAFPQEDLAGLKHDGIILRTAGERLYLLGGRPRGTLYAVYTFLEDIVGVRWWGSRPDETFIPHRPTLEIPELNTRYVPALQYREAFYRGALEGLYAARSKCNGHFARIPEEYGGHYRILGWCHTFYQLLPPAQYFKEHPEWYSEINGRRVAEHAQLCLTNEEMRAELTRQALAWLRRDPSAGIISISQNDCYGACQCARCKAVVAEEGAESGMLLRFINAVAEEIEKEFPGTLVETLAYTYTRKPPQHVRPRHNVIIRLCSIEASSAQPLATGPQNESFRRDIEGWSAIAPQLYIWNYVTNFANYISPHPNWRVLGPDIRFFVAHKAIGLFEQGDAGSTCSDFPELRAWLLAHLMWDPSRDERALIEEFMRGYYGPAAEPLLEYMALLEKRLDESGAPLPCFMRDTSSWLDLKTANRATELFAEALRRVADNPGLTKRVRRAKMPLDHNWLQRYTAYKREAALTGQPFAGPSDPRAAVEEFIQAAHEFDVGQFREGAPFAKYEPILRGLFPEKEPAPPAEAAGLKPEDWADIQQGEFRLYGLGQWASVVSDDKASDGLAASMPATHKQWAVQYYLLPPFTDNGQWRCYAVVRCEAKAQTGPAFQIGIYDSSASKGVVTQTITLEQAKDNEYHTYDLGTHELKRGMYFWFAPMNNPEQVSAIYVDRIFLIRMR